MKQINRDFILNIGRLFSGNLTASAIMFLTMPLISRLYSPADFGQTSYFVSIASVVAAVSSLRYDASIVIAENQKMAMIMAINSALICLSISLSFWVLTSFLPVYNIRFLAPIADVIYLLPIIIFLAGSIQIIYSLFTRDKRFGSIAVFNISKTSVQQGYRVLAALIGKASAFSLIVALALGQVASLILFFKQLKCIFRKARSEQITARDLIFGLKRYKAFPLFSSFSFMCNLLGMQLPVLFIGYFFGIKEAGFYAMTAMLLSIPKSLTGAISQVLYQRAAEVQNIGYLKDFIQEVYWRLVLYSAIPFFLVMFYGRTLYSFIFGPEWEQAGFYGQIVAPLFWMVFCTSPLGSLYNIRERQKENTIFVIARLIFQFAGMVVGCLMNDIRISLFLYAVFGIVFRCASVFWIMTKIGIRLSNSLSCMLRSIFFSASPLIFWITSRLYFDVPAIIDIIILSMIVIIVYSIAIWHDPPLRNSLKYYFSLSFFQKMKNEALK
jgi:O-antigen/teichoic acid export membrane protein